MLSWFKKNPPSFEHILSALADDIANREAALQELALSKQRTTLLFTSYASMLYALYALAWWFGWLATEDELQEILKGALLLLLPASIYGVRRVLIAFYDRKRHRHESQLKTLRAQQKEQVDKIKKQTKFDETRSLLEKYTDEPPVPSSPQGTPFQAQRRMPRHSIAAVVQTPKKSPKAGAPRVSEAAAAAIGPHQRGWVDRFADAILGDNEQSPAQKYALICAKCHAHNGLVLREELGVTQYNCPKCGHFNPAKQVPTSILEGSRPTPKLSNSFSTPNLSSQELQAPVPQSRLPQQDAGDSSVEEISAADMSIDSVDEAPEARPGKPKRRKSSKRNSAEEE